MILDWTILFATCATCAVAAVYWLGRRSDLVDDTVLPNLTNRVYFFAGNDLLDASSGAQELPDGAPEISDWQRLYDMVADRFPGFPTSCDQIQKQGRLVIPAGSDGDSGSIIGEWIDGLTRIELHENPIMDAQNRLSLLSHEQDSLRAAIDEAPYPVWQVEDSGKVAWYNRAYAAVYQQVRKSEPNPDQPLFKPSSAMHAGHLNRRVSIAAQDNEKSFWFNVSAVQQDGYCLFYASDINAVVDAEIAQRNFVQTLAKTFAQLSIGLAIFDRNRQLVLFNPALIDLTSLSADFLSGRPNLFSFFDRLRDSQMMPEPKSYKGWRHQLTHLVEAAADGRYQETWSLPSGSVYSVNGRPHPDGAVAFLFEDITAEVTLTRRFRSDLELGQSILDNLPDAIVVFGSDGILNMCNAAYRGLWKVNPDNSFANVTIVDSTREWQSLCDATPVWGDIREFVASRDDRAEWWAQVQTKSGETLVCTVYPVQSGATMVSFSRQPHPAEQTAEPHRTAETT